MLLEKSSQGALELACAVPMNDPHDALIAQERLVEKPLRTCEGRVHRAADHVQVAADIFSRLQIDVDDDTRPRIE